MNQMSKRRRKSTAWPKVLCPKMEARLVKAYNKGRGWIISQSNDNVYEVHSYPSVLVDVDRPTYRLSYASSITPIPTVEKPSFQLDDFVIYPPVVKRPLGRTKKKTYAFEGGRSAVNSLQTLSTYGEPQQEDMQRTNLTFQTWK
ncbi:hypothetical protein ACSBR1_038544 [Camellia fascicularis]